MRRVTLTLALFATLIVPLSGCQSIQFVDSPIPVTANLSQASKLP